MGCKQFNPFGAIYNLMAGAISVAQQRTHARCAKNRSIIAQYRGKSSRVCVRFFSPAAVIDGEHLRSGAPKCHIVIDGRIAPAACQNVLLRESDAG